MIARLLYGLDLTKISPERAVPRIAPRPILFVHGSDDDVIPIDHARRLIAASENAADDLWSLDGMGHTEGVLTVDQQVSPIRAAYLSRDSPYGTLPAR